MVHRSTINLNETETNNLMEETKEDETIRNQMDIFSGLEEL